MTRSLDIIIHNPKGHWMLQTVPDTGMTMFTFEDVRFEIHTKVIIKEPTFEEGMHG